ncbi:MAG: phytanoyl-CoA dioxygenase [Gemmatimonadetes bacterium]|nr:phytanoyl-CoA dioxygenase [Gemmatimonadota bacterium]|tara:strand:- start:2929 stop:3723 length:795 start_codon:yes stop_codon:yes gene_type:complete
MISSFIGLYGDEHHEHFDEFGYIRLGKLVSPNELRDLCDRVDDLMMGHVTYDDMKFQLDGNSPGYSKLAPRSAAPTEKSLNYRRIDGLYNDPDFLVYSQHPVFRRITRRYIGEHVSAFRAMIMNKPAGLGTELPWHQDIGEGWGLDRNPTVTIWTALDPMTVDNGAMQIVPGSHKLGILNKGHYTSEADIEAHASASDVVDLTAEAGEAILIHNWMLHRSGVNDTTGPRRAYSIAYMDADTVAVESGEPFPVIFGENALRPAVS